MPAVGAPQIANAMQIMQQGAAVHALRAVYCIYHMPVALSIPPTAGDINISLRERRPQKKRRKTKSKTGKNDPPTIFVWRFLASRQKGGGGVKNSET
jgi:hypothetical protein